MEEVQAFTSRARLPVGHDGDGPGSTCLANCGQFHQEPLAGAHSRIDLPTKRLTVRLLGRETAGTGTELGGEVLAI